MSTSPEFQGFQIEEVLSRSSTTTVYRAFQDSLKRKVLIKELRPELFQEEDLRVRFEREAQVCAHIKHENIVDIYEYSSNPSRTYLVMELVDGCSLSDFIRNHPNPPLNLIYSIILQTLAGLRYAHSRGVIHRDLKPGNILIARDGWVKITDFGLAQFEGAPQVTRSGAIVGTPAYLSPEAISGKGITAKSDIFSLGVTFYQLLTGVKIFHAEHFSDSLNKVLSFHPPKPSIHRPDLPPEVDRIILRMLEKQPAKRWNNPDEIIAEFQKVEGIQDLVDTRLLIRRHWEKPHDSGDSESHEMTDTTIKRIRKKKTQYRWIGITLVLMMAALIAVYISWKPGSTVINESPDNNASEPAASLGEGIVEDSISERKESSTIEIPEDSLLTSTVPADEVIHPAASDPVLQETVQKPETSTSTGMQEPSDSAVTAEDDTVLQMADIPQAAIPATVQIQCAPWADVYIDDNYYGKTPLDLVTLDPGLHRLVFRHPEFAPVFRDISPTPGERLRVEINFWETVGRLVILVNTWAEVYVDGQFKDVTPLREPLIVPLGTHTIMLKNPAAEPWIQEQTFKKGDPPCTLRVELNPTQG